MHHQPTDSSAPFYQLVNQQLAAAGCSNPQSHPLFIQYQYPTYHEALAASLEHQLVQLQHSQSVGRGPAPIQALAFHPDFRPHQTFPTKATQQAQHYRHYQLAMANFGGMTDEELAELQQRSNEYEPEAEGPLVGQRESSTAITLEYGLIDTDPVFQAKTRMLPSKYSHYRKIRGDGKCGWRAIAYGYFEALVSYGDANKFLMEEARMKSLLNVIAAAGIDTGMYNDFADEVYEVLRNAMAAMRSGDAETVLMNAFNDETIQNYIITCFKVCIIEDLSIYQEANLIQTLTSSWMKTRADLWVHFVPGQSVETYCDHEVLPNGSEIDNVSLQALQDVLLAPAGIAVEVLYLDRSEGTEVNAHHLGPVNSSQSVIGTIRLLYRPGHYDLLYKIAEVSAIDTAIPTYLQHSFHAHQEPAREVGLMDCMSAIPGFSYVPQQDCWSTGIYSASDFDSVARPAQQRLNPTTVVTAQPQVQPPSTYLQGNFTQLPPAPDHTTQELVLRPASRAAATSMASQLQHQVVGGGPFRPSAWELEGDFLSAQSQLPLTTSIFRNSHFNTAHFLNPEFQPEEWRPDEEHVTPGNRDSRPKSEG